MRLIRALEVRMDIVGELFRVNTLRAGDFHTLGALRSSAATRMRIIRFFTPPARAGARQIGVSTCRTRPGGDTIGRTMIQNLRHHA